MPIIEMSDELSGRCARVYIGTTNVLLPGGTELVCKSHKEANILKDMINLLVTQVVVPDPK